MLFTAYKIEPNCNLNKTNTNLKLIMKVTKEIAEIAYQKYLNNTKLSLISKEYGCTYTHLRERIKHYIPGANLSLFRTKIPYEIAEKAFNVWKNRGDVTKFSKENGFKEGSIRNAMKMHFKDYNPKKIGTTFTEEKKERVFKIYSTGKCKGSDIIRKIPCVPHEAIKAFFESKGLTFGKDINCFGNILTTDLERDIIDYYMNNDVSYRQIQDKFNVTWRFLTNTLNNVTPYKSSLVYLSKFSDLIIEHKSIKKACDASGIPKSTLLRNIKLIMPDYEKHLEAKVKKEPKKKEVKPKDPKTKKEVKKKLPKVKKSKTNTKIGKKVDDLRMFKATEMQKGEVKVPKNKKVFETLPKEKHNAGYLLRIDDKTSIFVKDGSSPEVARQRYFERLAKRKD